MRIIIVEDEQHNSKLLIGMIRQLRPSWEIMGSFEDVEGTVRWLEENEEPDLIFMDIQLSDDICFSIFDQVEVKSMVIFTTAYDEYAVQAFKVNSVDYLLKPIKLVDLESAILKFEKIYRHVIPVDYKMLLEAIKDNKKEYRKRFLITEATAFTKVNVSDIAFFYTEERVTFAVTFKNKRHIIDLTIESLEEQLDPDIFFRANRSYIISNEVIHKVENYFGSKLLVKLIAPFNETITVSRLKATVFKNWMDK